MWLMHMKQASSSMKRTQCLPAACMVGARWNILALRTAFEFYTEPSPKRLERWVDLFAAQGRRSTTFAFTRIPTFTPARCFRSCVTANHTRADLDEALNILSDTLVPVQMQSAL